MFILQNDYNANNLTFDTLSALLYWRRTWAPRRTLKHVKGRTYRLN